MRSEGIGDPGGIGVGPDLGDGIELGELAVDETGEVGGIGQGFAGLMGDFDAGEALFGLEFAEETAEVATAGGIEVGEGFVEEEEGGFGEESASEGDAGGFAAGELGRGMMETVIEAESGGDLEDLMGAGMGWGVMDAEGEVELVGDGKVREESWVLG
jgi:hypothetical protein